MTEVYDYTSAPWRRGILDMSRGTKSKAVSGERGSLPRDESESGKMEITGYFRMLNSRLEEQEKRSDSRFEALQEDLRNTNQRLEELQLQVPRPRLADVGVQEGKSGELEGIATEAGERRITQSELQHQAHQPRLAMKADVQEDKTTRESTEDFAQDGRLGDISYISSDRVHDPMRLASFGVKIAPNLRLSLAGMIPWSIKAMKWRSRVSHPWRCASQHLPAAY